MGAGASTGKEHEKLQISKIARKTSFEAAELLALHAKFAELGQKGGGDPGTITIDEFDEAVAAVKVVEKDEIMLNVMFKHFDVNMGSGDAINFTDFVTCCSTMVTGGVEEKLRFSFELRDPERTGKLSRADLESIFKAVNNTASWFGDPTLSEEELNTLLADAFKDVPCEPGDETGSALLEYEAYLQGVGAHPVVVAFIQGEGKGPVVDPTGPNLPLSPTSPVAIESFAAMDKAAAEIREQARIEAASGSSDIRSVTANAKLPPKSPGSP